MANQEHLDILNQGVKVWNRWREEHPEMRPDLSEANILGKDLSQANLSKVFFYRVELMAAQLTYANLYKSDLVQSRLHGANFTQANLTEAELNGADLGSANLTQANLCGAYLAQAKLEYANLTGTDFSEAKMFSTIFGMNDLRQAKGLDSVRHAGSSIIGLDTIYRSRGQIPKSFLRKAGVPETFITNMRALVNSMSPIEFYSCFISYSHQNEDFAKRLNADLQREGVRCWFADEDLKIGDHYHQRIDEAIRLYDKLILVLSDTAMRSAWVEREVLAAREKEERERREVLFPIRLDDAVMETTQAWAADMRRRWHIGDFTQWKQHNHYQKALERLLRDLRSESQQ